MIRLKPEVHKGAIVKLSLEAGKASSVGGGLLFKFKGGYGIMLYDYGAKVMWYCDELWWPVAEILHRLPEGTWDSVDCPPKTTPSMGPKIAEWIDLALNQIKAKI